MEGNLAERVRQEFGFDRDGSHLTVPGPGWRESDASIDQRVGELIGDSLVLQEAIDRVSGNAILPATTDLLADIRNTQRSLFVDLRIQIEERGPSRKIRLVVVEYLDHRVAFMDNYLDPGFSLGEGLDFIAMCLAEALGRWGVLARLAESDPPLVALAEEAHELLEAQLASVLEAIAAPARSD